jgi:hypothetical protein
LDETRGIVAMTKVFHLDHVINEQSAHEDIQTLLDRFTEVSTGIGSGGIPIWWWDISIHQSDRLLQMMRMIDRVMSVIGLRHCGDVVRGFIDLCSIWRGRFLVTIPKIEPIHRLDWFDFIEMPWRDMI